MLPFEPADSDPPGDSSTSINQIVLCIVSVSSLVSVLQ